MDKETLILEAMEEAERKAWEALAGYKFWMFGYHAARWINYNKLLSKPRRNPFSDSVELARQKIEELEQRLAWLEGCWQEDGTRAVQNG